ncbi:MAG: hypothetical protein M3365_06900, partial [Gemmatimonadota bacterium]|nr:hypothetical protein [Gemmatimonadota bacterium]
ALMMVAAFLPLVLAFVGCVPWLAILILLSVGAVFAWRVSGTMPSTASATGIGASAVLVMMLVMLSRGVDRAARRLFAPPAGSTIVDVIRSPDPGNPLCWSVIGVELREAAGMYVLRPGTFSVAPGVVPPVRCASHRVRGTRVHEQLAPELVADGDIHQSLDILRQLNSRDCSVRAWLQFSRAPVIKGGEAFDQRFARGRDNFSAMSISEEPRAATCPPNLTSWDPPRRDLLQAR